MKEDAMIVSNQQIHPLLDQHTCRCQIGTGRWRCGEVEMIHMKMVGLRRNQTLRLLLQEGPCVEGAPLPGSDSKYTIWIRKCKEKVEVEEVLE